MRDGVRHGLLRDDRTLDRRSRDQQHVLGQYEVNVRSRPHWLFPCDRDHRHLKWNLHQGLLGVVLGVAFPGFVYREFLHDVGAVHHQVDLVRGRSDLVRVRADQLQGNQRRDQLHHPRVHGALAEHRARHPATLQRALQVAFLRGVRSGDRASHVNRRLLQRRDLDHNPRPERGHVDHHRGRHGTQAGHLKQPRCSGQ